MTTLTSPSLTTQPTARTTALSGLRFDWLMSFLGVWLIGGLYLDGWAHNHNIAETFFTPWHGALYSGFLIQAAVLTGLFVNQLRQGQAITQALPHGYGLSLTGVGIFAIGGIGDMIWHIVFGIEIGIEALFSPTHLFLATGGVLLITGPLRAAFQRGASTWVNSLPMITSATTLFCTLTFFAVYANPFANVWVSTYDRPYSDYTYITQAIGITAILFYAALLTALLLVIVRNNQLLSGHLFIFITVNSLASIIINNIYLNVPLYSLILISLLAGLTAEILFWLLKPSIANIRNLRCFSAAVPATLFAIYFTILLNISGLWWNINLWGGAIFLAGVIGLMVNYLVIPSAYEKITLKA